MNKTKKLRNLLICLEALDLYYGDAIINYLGNKRYNLSQETQQHCTTYLHATNQIILLYNIQQASTINYIKDKVHKILEDYSLINHKYSPITMQYLRRFIYKYNKSCKEEHYDQMKNLRLKTKELQDTAVASLYILYTILFKESAYFLYKYLRHNSAININNK